MHQDSGTSIMRTFTFGIICSALAVSVVAQTPADNTKTNTRDRVPGAVTADQQKENAGDRDLTKKIRQSLTKDKSLSTYAHNIKIVAQGGQVTLKGPVRSEDEKQAVAAKAAAIAGADHVVNEITVAPEATTAKKPKS